MKVYLVTWVYASDQEIVLNNIGSKKRLVSYYEIKEKRKSNKRVGGMENKKIDLFLDSGAFSAWSKGIKINIQEYISFIKEYKDCLTLYANLDVIGDPQATWENQKIMEGAGLQPLPCFHYGENPKWLLQYLKDYDYLALGGMVGTPSSALALWLDETFNYICDAEGFPKIKVHGYGLTSLRFMLRYPWYSVDSTSWVITGRLGAVLVPRFREGRWIYDEDSYKIAVSSRSPDKNEGGKHIDTLSPQQREIILMYFREKGYALGKSEFRWERADYKLKEGERWFEEVKNEKRRVERVIEGGLCNDYSLRDELNIIYFLDLEKSIPPYPRQFVRGSSRGFGV